MGNQNFSNMSDDQIWDALTSLEGFEKADAMTHLSYRAFERREYDRVITLTQEAAVIATNAGDRYLAGFNRQREGAANFNLGNYGAAVDNYINAIEDYSDGGNQLDMAEIYSRLSDTYRNLENYDAAISAAQAGRALAEAEENPSLSGNCAFMEGKALYYADREEESLKVLTLAKHYLRKSNDINGVVRIDDFAATVNDFLENYEVASELLLGCLHIAEATVEEHDNPYAHRRYGNSLAKLGRYSDAIVHFEKAIDAYRTQGNLRIVALTNCDLADCLANLDKYEDAIAIYEKAQALFDGYGDDENVRHCKIRRSQLSYGLGDYVQAERLARQVLVEIDSDPTFKDDAHRYWIQIHIIDDLIRLERYTDVVEFASLMNDFHVGVFEMWKIAKRTFLARALYKLGRENDALAEVDAALSMLTDDVRSNGNAYLYEIRGKILLSRNNKSGERDLAHAIAIHLSAGRDDKARELAVTFLPVLPEPQGLGGDTAPSESDPHRELEQDSEGV